MAIWSIIYYKMPFLMHSIVALVNCLYFYIERMSFMEKEMINRLKIVLAEEQEAVSGWQNNLGKTGLLSDIIQQIKSGEVSKVQFKERLLKCHSLASLHRSG